MFIQLRDGDADDLSGVMQSHAATLQRSMILNPKREKELAELGKFKILKADYHRSQDLHS